MPGGERGMSGALGGSPDSQSARTALSPLGTEAALQMS